MKINETKTFKKLKTKKKDNDLKWLVVHHTGGTDADPQADSSHHTTEMIEQWHMSKGWEGIGYHYVIQKDGSIWAGRPENYHSAAVLNHNSDTLNINMTGNFDRKEGLQNRVPTKEQEESFKWLYRDIIKRHPQLTSDKVIPHRKLQVKSCYGINLSDTYASELAKKAIQESMPELIDNTPEAKALCLSIEQADQLKQKVNNKEVLGLFAFIKKLFK